MFSVFRMMYVLELNNMEQKGETDDLPWNAILEDELVSCYVGWCRHRHL